MSKHEENKAESKEILKAYKKVTVIGAGAIGNSWIALFLANDLDVTINDPRPDVREDVIKAIDEIKPTLKELGYKIKGLEKNLHFEKDVNKAVADADLIIDERAELPSSYGGADDAPRSAEEFDTGETALRDPDGYFGCTHGPGWRFDEAGDR